MIFRLSQKLSTKLKEGTLPPAPLDENPFADWSAQLFIAGRAQYILLTNTKSLYSTVMYGRGNTYDGQFILRALSNIREFMEDDGQGFIYHRFIVPATGSVRFAKALNRSVVGSMNDLVKQATFMLDDGEVAPSEVGFKLNETPMSALGGGGLTHGFPRKVFKELMGGVEVNGTAGQGAV